jgi:indole-3-glycerol phosphate synthase
MTGTILDEILAHKAVEVEARKARQSLAEIERAIATAPAARGFVRALQEAVQRGGAAVIAEVKKASPSKGVIRPDFQPVAIARSYQAAGASCLSVLTDEKYFQGSDIYLGEIRKAVDLPLLRKEFIVDEFQIAESRLIGADCILLIVAALSPATLSDFYQQAQQTGLDVLIEVHDAEELELALSLEPSLVGINNRNLKTFETSLSNTFDLLDSIPDDVLVVTESGIHSREDVQAMRERDVHAFLVGEAFMRADDPGAALKNLFD